MSTTTYQPLRALPPLDQKRRFAWLLALRDAAGRTLNRALSAPRRAVAYVLRAGATALARLTPPPVAGFFGWLAGQAVKAVPLLRSVGSVTASVVVLTTPPIQRLALQGVRLFGRLVGRVLRANWSAVDASLRFFGDTGCRSCRQTL